MGEGDVWPELASPSRRIPIWKVLVSSSPQFSTASHSRTSHESKPSLRMAVPAAASTWALGMKWLSVLRP